MTHCIDSTQALTLMGLRTRGRFVEEKTKSGTKLFKHLHKYFSILATPLDEVDAHQAGL